MLLTACNLPKTMYLVNKLDKAITLSVDSSLDFDGQLQSANFRDSIDGKRIEPGNTFFNYGEGKWNKADQDKLRNILQKTTIQVDDSAETFRLPENIRVQHITLFVEELLVRINKLEPHR